MRCALFITAAAAFSLLAPAASAGPFVWTRGVDDAIETTPPASPLPALTSGKPCAFADRLTAAALEEGIAPELAIAVAWAETRCRHAGQRSPKGAIGLMQLMPATARRFGAPDPTDLDRNIAAGVAYLRWLSDRYGGDARRVLAGYNAGEGAVDRYGGVPPYAETRAYVAAITARLDSEDVSRPGTVTVRTSFAARVEAPFVLTLSTSEITSGIVTID